MMKNQRVTLLVMLAILSGYSSFCAANTANEQFLALNESVRSRLFQSVMSTQGIACSGVDEHAFQQLDGDQTAYWTIGCANSEFYSVQVANDKKGSIRVRACIDMLESKIPCDVSQHNAGPASDELISTELASVEHEAIAESEADQAELSDVPAEEPKKDGGWFW